uniref:RING-CH-type domain-containing protein n=1 Tax=Elaeophora elaphi TaxID=1147741 RepID=A0A0R3RH26_9BILA
MRSHSASISSAICRICRSGEPSIAHDKSTDHEPLISLCLCRGTIGLYHRSCLERWLALSDRSVCEICHFTYQTSRRYRTFCEFLGSRDSHLERRNLITDITCFVFFTPIVIGCIILCLASEAQIRDLRLWNNVAACQAISLLILSVLLSVAYFIWLIVTTVFHIKTYCDWRALNEEVLVVDQESACNLREAVCGIRRQRWEQLRAYAMRLLCFDVRSFLHDIFSKNLDASSAPVNNVNPGYSTVAAHQRQISTVSSYMNYNDFVHHLQTEIGANPVIGSCQQTLSSTPVVNEEVASQIFQYPSIDSHLSDLI